MFKVPMYNFNYDHDRRLLDLPQNKLLKDYVVRLYEILRNHFLIDFMSINTDQFRILEEVRKILHSEVNRGSRVVYNVINYYNINVRRSNKVEENNMLHLLCACGRFEDVMWYLNEFPKVKVNTNNHIMQTPIQFAIAIGNSPEIAFYLYQMTDARLYPDDTHPIEDGYTVVDALYVRWVLCEEYYFSTWGAFADLICYDRNVAALIKTKLPILYNYSRSDMVFN